MTLLSKAPGWPPDLAIEPFPEHWQYEPPHGYRRDVSHGYHNFHDCSPVNLKTWFSQITWAIRQLHSLQHPLSASAPSSLTLSALFASARRGPSLARPARAASEWHAGCQMPHAGPARHHLHLRDLKAGGAVARKFLLGKDGIG